MESKSINKLSQWCDKEKVWWKPLILDGSINQLSENLEWSNITWDSELIQNLLETRRSCKGMVYLKHLEKQINKLVNKIPINLNKDNDGSSRLINFVYWDKPYEFLNIDLDKHSEKKYKIRLSNWKVWVKLWWMMWDDVNRWNNKELKEYILEKKTQWFKILTIEEMKNILDEFLIGDLKWTDIRLFSLFYLTWMVDEIYWLWMWNADKSEDKKCRSWVWWLFPNFCCSSCVSDWALLFMFRTKQI